MRLSSTRAVIASCFMLLLAACGGLPVTPTATVDYDHSYDFSRAHKIAIQPIPRDTLDTMMISDEQIARVNQALVTELQRRGFEVVAKNIDADMFLSWRFVPQESDMTSTFDPAKQHIVNGMLYVSMIDPVMLQSVWRASFQSDLSERMDEVAAMQYRQSVAQAILAQFPPGPAAH